MNKIEKLLEKMEKFERQLDIELKMNHKSENFYNMTLMKEHLEIIKDTLLNKAFVKN